MTVDEALSFGKTRIEPREAMILLSHASGFTHTDIRVHGERSLPLPVYEAYTAMLEERVQKKPLQYIVKRWPFMGLEFITDERALIPRPDTEVLVEAVLDYICKKNKPLCLLDLCTGSGCIGISLAHLAANLSVTAADLSPDALSLAKENAVLNGVAGKIRFVVSDLFSQLAGDEGAYDIIVSNPPYIPTAEIKTLDREVQDYEPHTALDGGEDGLAIYARLIPQSVRYLCPDGALFLEIGPAAGVTAIMADSGFTQVTMLRDFAGLERVIHGRLKYV